MKYPNNANRDFEWAVKLNRISLEMIGLWPKPEKIRRDELKRNLYVFVVLLMLVIVGLFPCTLSLLRIQQNFTLIIEQLQFLLPLVTCVIRLVIFWWKKEAVISIMNMIVEDWLNSKNIQEKNIMITWAQKPRKIIMIAYSIMGISYACVVVLPVLGISVTYTGNITDINKILPLQGFFIYDATKTPLYILTYIAQVITFFFAVMAYTGIDNFLGLLVFHICGQMEILMARFSCLSKLTKFRNGLESCVRNHIRLLRAIAIIEDTYNKILLALFLYFGLLFAFFGFLLISLIEESYVSITRILYLVSNLINMIVHMVLYCAVGEILVSQCDKVYYAICDQEWYLLDPRNAKDLIFLMIRTRISSYITAGKIFPMTMATFCNLVKTSVSYVSVMVTIKN
ncbi:odorant receptor 49b-like isoform X1 [Ooceraea biroi]|uniref:odorant receptor 49b-like isoform X1 n=1 Tax=Ooceraea biroi TaxID=2015173 RepID=UPI000F079C91|nr:odorant receptor 49b-like isoform X1 [Ooceraea biroi]XP_026826828.1 odorant receptor 49b-like isoform X1 [Ooceraea biroi]